MIVVCFKLFPQVKKVDGGSDYLVKFFLNFVYHIARL